MSVELFAVKKCSKTSKGFVFLKLTAKPKVLESLKRSWKKSWKVMEFEELKRVRTLDMTSADIPLTVSATAFQNQDGGSFTKLWTDFLIKIFRVGKIYANQDTPGNIIMYIKVS